MKIILYFLLIISFSSCEEIICDSNQTDLANEWTALPTETIRFIPSIERDIIEFRISDIVRLGTANDCYSSYETRSVFGQDTITNTYLRGITYEIVASKNDVNINYWFLPASPVFTGVTNPDIQKIGCLSLIRNSDCNDEKDERNEIGDFTINGIPHKDVIELKENRRTGKEKEVKKILVNKKGILQIEFYDGEVWSRIF
ncbi:hypothetical protein Fleli_2587 [Bernardetia litoralis DSM 6794]|uniref:Uncharacterized protein n=1 Tax=Bernardetia litoralis (strain ATCC 23117 / DSM 6794 / NBRC 15988 / NCIMB 1366 / Fx l1 / Sio-4) TaxID=880071 RepID=I4ALW5_BERLS|nr:hypothetical protein [Bernardetia litoralis]AFM04950.1 hypothetical protein Fleli_2587 [Bernardetia litoralis DSM 6794]